MFIGRLNCLFLSLCILHLSMLSDGRPLRKRSVTEVQLMHNQGVHKHVHERQDWLNKRLQNIHAVTSSSRGSAERAAGPPDKTHRERRLLPGEDGGHHRDLKDLTPEEMEFALSFLDRLLDSKN